MLRSLPIAHRVAIGAAVVVVVLAGVLFTQWISNPSYSVLASGVDATELSEITSGLESASIDYQIEGGGERVMVVRKDLARAKGILADSGISTTASGDRDRGYELLDNQGFGLSTNLERINVQRALEGELARSLRAMELVTDAVVHLVVPEDTLFSESEAASASVIVDVKAGFGAAEATAVASLVSGAVDNLATDAVTIIDLQGRTLLAPDDGSGIVDAGRTVSQTRQFEKQIEDDITRLLLSAGAGARSTVMVQATLDFDQVSRRTETFDTESQVPIRESILNEAFTGDSSLAPGGVPGVDGDPIDDAIDATGDGIAYEKTDTTTEYGVDNIVTSEVQAAGTVTKLHIGVVIDDGTITQATVPDSDTVSALISNAVGVDAARGDSIVVVAVPFPVLEETELLALPAPVAATSSPLDLIPQAVGALVLIVVLVVVVLMLKSAGKEVSIPTASELSPAPSASAAAIKPAEEALAAQTNARAEVRRLVERQPEEIAGLLRAWLADA